MRALETQGIKGYRNEGFYKSVSAPERTGPSAQDYRSVLEKKVASADKKSYMDIQASSLHKEVMGPDHAKFPIQICCETMLSMMRPEDRVLSDAKKMVSAGLVIRYNVPL